VPTQRIMKLDATRLTSHGVPGGLSILELGKGPFLEVDGVGAGCMCLSRKVLWDTRLSFYPVPEQAVRSRNQRVVYQSR
jgi:hypothetical protein